MFNLETKEPYNNCYDHILWNIARYYDAPEQIPLVYANSICFGFDFKNENKTIGERILVYTEGDLSSKILGIKRFEIKFSSNKDLINFIKNKLAENIPVAGYVDPFYLPWTVFHREKKHANHAIMFMGYDDVKKIIYCSDRLMTSKIEELPYDLIDTNMCFNCFFFKKIGRPPTYDKYKSFTLIHNYLQNYIENKISEKIASFAKYLSENLNIEHEIAGYDNPQTAPFVIKFYSFGHARVKFARMLEFLKSLYREYNLDPFIDRIREIAEKWNNINLAINKRIIQKKYTQVAQNILNALIAVQEEELLFVQTLKDYLKSQIINNLECENTYTGKTLTQIDISEYFDNRAYGENIENIINANYNDSGEFAVLGDMIEKNILCYDSLKFISNIFDFNKPFDNFACNNQTIQIPSGNYCQLLVIASSQFGAQNVYVKLYYEDGTFDIALMKISDWRSVPKFDEIVLYSGYCCKIEGEMYNTIGNCYLFLQKLDVDDNKKLNRIAFSYQPNINVFAIGGMEYCEKKSNKRSLLC